MPSSSHVEKLDDPPVPWMHGAAGILGGSISMTLFYPLDMLRTRMHIIEDNQKRKTIDAVRTVIKQEGVKGLYRGVKVAVAAHSLGWGLYLTLFRCVQQNIEAIRGEPSTLGDFIGATCAATMTATFVTPINLVKTRTQLAEIPKEQRGVLKVIRRTAEREGWRTLFRGVGPQILLSLHTTIQVALYECLKRSFWGEKDAPMSGVALVSGLSKAVAATICNPLEVMKTRLQDKKNSSSKEYSSMRSAFETIKQKEGYRGFYRGVTVNVCRVVPTTVVAFVLYEQCLQFLNVIAKTLRRDKMKPPQAVK
jgi:solute carrier family 25 folate transporter 32